MAASSSMALIAIFSLILRSSSDSGGKAGSVAGSTAVSSVFSVSFLSVFGLMGGRPLF